MGRIFEKISKAQDYSFKLPERSTKNSAGYDFYAPENIIIKHSDISNNSEPYCIKTKVKVKMEEDECLMVYPRSSWPSRLGLVMANSVGIIDSDYYNNLDNEGEIGFLVYNLGPTLCIHKGEKIGQGIFTKFLITNDDNASGSRNGGFGSTGA